MSALLAKLKLDGATILDPMAALQILAVRGEWSEIARRVSEHMTGSTAGSVLRFSDIGLAPDDFKRTTATASRKVGEIDYSGITTAARSYGVLVKRLTDESRGFYVPRNQAEIVERVKVQRSKAAAKAKAKAAKAAAAK